MRQKDLSWRISWKPGNGWVPMLMVLAQPDMGTALTYIPIRRHGIVSGNAGTAGLYRVVIAGALLAVGLAQDDKHTRKTALTILMPPEADRQGRISGEPVVDRVGQRAVGEFDAGSQTHYVTCQFHRQTLSFGVSEERGFSEPPSSSCYTSCVLMRLTQNAQTAPDRAGAFIVMGCVRHGHSTFWSTSVWWLALCRSRHPVCR